MYEIPKMMTGKALTDELTVLPEYDPAVREKEPSERLVALSDIYKLYVPSSMSVEIYSKLYLSLVRSLRKKDTKDAIKQYYENAMKCFIAFFKFIIDLTPFPFLSQVYHIV